ncbi:hypothetical protein GOV08_01150 [Candidatus Woesearchaeota archaeon]|nr:hypothetical protein [Candidatus Woesearchaeota archaeon]
MKKDIFANEYKNLLFIGLILIAIIANFLQGKIKYIIHLLFFFTFGVLCLFNFNRCGRIHCHITGYGFMAVGILALLSLLEVINLSWSIIWIIFIVIAIFAYSIEFLYKNKKGVCYKK